MLFKITALVSAVLFWLHLHFFTFICVSLQSLDLSGYSKVVFSSDHKEQGCQGTPIMALARLYSLLRPSTSFLSEDSMSADKDFST